VAANAALDRVRHVVYLAAGLPIEGQPMHAAGAGRALGAGGLVALSDDGQRATLRSAEAAIDFFFYDCFPEVARWAYTMLTPQPLAPLTEPISISDFWDSDLPRSLILCRRTAPAAATSTGRSPGWASSRCGSTRLIRRSSAARPSAPS
jgi:hypothetical protein